jgi:hypothetical protein
LLVAIVLAPAHPALGQQTRPSGILEAATTPRGAVKLLNKAMRDGDRATIEKLLLALSPAEKRMVAADAEMAVAFADLRDAAMKEFGRSGADIVTGDSDAGAADSTARIDSAEITINEDVATVVYRDQKNSPFVLRKIGGMWRVPVAQLGKPLDPAALAQRLADLSIQRQVIDEMAEDIRHKKFTTADEAKDAWRIRILQAATSQPTTKPSGT